MTWTGHDDFAGNNVDSIVLEVPTDLLGPGPVIGAWASISRRHDGVLEQLDRGGNPTVNPFINPDGEKKPQWPQAHRRRLQLSLRVAQPRQGPPTGLETHGD